MKQICIWGGLILSLALFSPATAQKTTQKTTAATKSSATQKSTTTGKNAATAQKSDVQKEGILPFKGLIEYKVEYKVGNQPMPIPTNAQPGTATVQISDTKLLMEAGAIKTILNADEKRAYNLLNYTDMGISKYVITATEEELRNVEGMTNYVYNPTGEVKTILGYRVKKATGSFSTPQTSMSFEVWYVENFCPPFFNLVKNMFVGIQGFPLEYTMTMKTIQGYEETVVFTVDKITYGETDPKTFNIPSGYQRVTEAELKKIMDDFMSNSMKRQ